MKYFVCKIKYHEPIPGKEGVKKVNKAYLVAGESVTDVEAKVQGWWPANWIDPVVKDVVSNNLTELHTEGESETWWLFKVMYEDMESGKWKPQLVAANGGTADITLKRVMSIHPMGEIEELKKFKVIVDEDLVGS
jgi:hypothetical protein